MDVAAFCSWPIGVASWLSPEPAWTLVVKTTWSFDSRGQVAPSEEQEPLTLNRPSAEDPGELSHASDFVPLKASADVLLVGGAYTATPARLVAASLAVDGMEKRFYALAGEPTTRIPLLRGYLRRMDRVDSDVVVVGPSARWTQEALRDKISPAGVPIDPVEYPFDFGVLNAAPRDQQIEALRPNARVRLLGLSPDAPRVDLALPAVRLRAYLVRRASSSLDDQEEEIALRCDTLQIDTDRARLTLTWRGVAFAKPGDKDPYFVVARDERSEWRYLRERLGRARWLRAREPDDLDAAASPYWEDEPTNAASADAGPPSDLTEGPPSSETTTKERVARRAGVELDQPREAEVTKVAPLPVPRRPTLPFVRPESSSPPAPAGDDRSRSWKRVGTDTVTGIARPALPVLPFEDGPTAELEAVDAAPPERAERLESSPPPAAVTKSASGPAASLASASSIPISEYAAVKAEIWHDGDLEGVLERHGLDLVAWRAIEQRQLEALSRSSPEERVRRMLALSEALQLARERLGRTREG